MREILFKAKRIDNCEWVEGSYAYVEHLGEHLILSSEKVDMGFDICFTTTQYRIDENTICQYTGLTDKNDNAIWENDIVRLDEDFYIVTWEEDDAMFALEDVGLIESFKNVDSKWCEVVGNIIDNPEFFDE